MRQKIIGFLCFSTPAILSLFQFGCTAETINSILPPTPTQHIVDRDTAIPDDARKITPAEDLFPPILHSDEWLSPIPLGSPINTAGAEDSPFITPDGKLFLFFFTPDVRIPVEKQLLDGSTGIYVSNMVNGSWSEPERVILQDTGKMSLEGCHFLQGEVFWFCTAREGNFRGVDLWTAEYRDGRWQNWTNAGEVLNVTYEVGEMHLTADLQTMYFHSSRAGGFGEYDIWVTHNTGEGWTEPENVVQVNTEANEGWPFITQDGQELWFLRNYQGYPAIFRSRWTEGEWSPPELILSQFAAEPALDNAGNLYFVHHYFEDGTMIEADIYVAYRK
jgi:hypothetical protein